MYKLTMFSVVLCSLAVVSVESDPNSFMQRRNSFGLGDRQQQHLMDNTIPGQNNFYRSPFSNQLQPFSGNDNDDDDDDNDFAMDNFRPPSFSSFMMHHPLMRLFSQLQSNLAKNLPDKNGTTESVITLPNGKQMIRKCETKRIERGNAVIVSTVCRLVDIDQQQEQPQQPDREPTDSNQDDQQQQPGDQQQQPGQKEHQNEEGSILPDRQVQPNNQSNNQQPDGTNELKRDSTNKTEEQ